MAIAIFWQLCMWTHVYTNIWDKWTDIAIALYILTLLFIGSFFKNSRQLIECYCYDSEQYTGNHVVCSVVCNCQKFEITQVLVLWNSWKFKILWAYRLIDFSVSGFICWSLRCTCFYFLGFNLLLNICYLYSAIPGLGKLRPAGHMRPSPNSMQSVRSFRNMLQSGIKW